MDDCLDGLALARDASIAGGLIGRMLVVSMIEKIAPTCVATFDSLPKATAADAISSLRAIREAMPGFGVTMREEAVQMQLYVHGPHLGDDFRDRLADRPKLMAKGLGGLEASGARRILHRALWRDYLAAMDEMAALCSQPDSERDSGFESLATRIDGRPSFIADGLPKPREYLRYARRADTSLRRLDLIIFAAAAKAYFDERGSWPSSIDALAEAGLVSDEEHRRGATVRFERDGEGLVIAIPLPSWSSDAPTEARARLGG